MHRLAPALLAAALPLSMLAFAPAVDDPTDESTTEESTEGQVAGDASALPEPVDVTMYFHGDGQRYIDDDAADPLAGVYRGMDRNAPTASEFDSRQLVNYAGGPNSQCSGNYLFPVWTGWLGNGTVVGDATLTIDAVGTGGPVIVEIYTGVAGQACNEAYVQPVATATGTLPTGPGVLEVDLPLDGFDPGFDMMVQIRPADEATSGLLDPSAQSRFLYDSTEYQGNISFTCQPDEITYDEDGEPSHTPDCLPF